MKKGICFALSAFTAFFVLSNSSNAQNVGINTTGATADPSAILDLKTGNAGNVGFLAPQASLTSTADVTTIPTPAIGLIVYNTNAAMGNGIGYYYYSGTTWLYLYNTGNALAAGWQLNGNNGTTASISAIGSIANNNFIGTTDAQDLVMAANGFERVRIAESTGYVGIGITNPVAPLDIRAGGYLHVSGTNTPALSTQGAYFSWNLTGGQGETDIINNQGLGSGGFTFYNTPLSGSPVTTLVNITGTGSMGIGANTPNRALEIEGASSTVRVDGLVTGNTFNSSTTASSTNLVYVNNVNGDVYSLPTVNSAILVTSAIGVPSWQTGTANGIDWSLKGNSGITASTSAIGSVANNNFIGTTGAADFVMAANGFERMRIAQSTGNIGIGIINPTAALDVHGTGYLHVSGTNIPNLAAQGAYYNWNLTGGQGETDLINNQGLGTGGFTFYNTPNSGSPATAIDRITGTGSIGIGANAPVRALEVEGTANTVRIDGLANGNTFNTSVTNAASNMVYVNNASGDMFSLPTVNNAILVTGATGIPSWQTGPTNGVDWSLTGNANTAAGTNFVGTTDAHDLIFKVNGNLSGMLDMSNSLTFYGYKAGINNTGKYSTGVGFMALAANTSGSLNTAVGDSSLYTNTAGSGNVAVGDNSLFANTTNSFCTAIGSGALKSNTANSNTALGYRAAYSNITGTGNTALGFEALMNSINDSINNTAVGYQAMYNCISHNTTAVGYQALYNNTGAQNTAMGYLAMNANTAGLHNAAFGYLSMSVNTTGNYNTAFGRRSLSGNTTGLGNTALGDLAMNTNTTGQYNVAVGLDAMGNNNIGNNNVGIGDQALAISDGTDNVGIGMNSLTSNGSGGDNVAIGSNTLQNSNNGFGNTAVGYNAMQAGNGGFDNTALGASTVISGGVSNSVALGYQALANNSNTIIMGNSFVKFCGINGAAYVFSKALIVGNSASNGNGAYCTIGGVWTNGSDRNIKTNFSTPDGQDILNKICVLPVLKWNYKGEPATHTHIGPMAQDFYKIFNVGDDSLHISTIDPAGVALIGVQELNKKLNKENAALKAELAETRDQLNERQASDEKKIAELENTVNTILKAQASIK